MTHKESQITKCYHRDYDAERAGGKRGWKLGAMADPRWARQSNLDSVITWGLTLSMGQ